MVNFGDRKQLKYLQKNKKAILSGSKGYDHEVWIPYELFKLLLS